MRGLAEGDFMPVLAVAKPLIRAPSAPTFSRKGEKEEEGVALPISNTIWCG